ncbi:MAG TPA: hypothetical protein DEF82_03555 [Crocinitomicaceae bacterium]|nr:DUF4296 domain-containing protein [Flavobacteriales bacterium]HBW85833.1 hypothetical protein [Crocinitomicaceae bacterium]
MKRLVFFGLILTACNSKEKPDVLPEEKMLLLMEEIYLIENHYQMTFGSPSVYKSTLDSSYQLILKENGVTQKQYEESFSYYASQPEIILNLQERLIERLNRKRVGL